MPEQAAPDNHECPLFFEDLNSGWQKDAIPECPWSTTIQHLDEMYDLYEIGNIRNALCLRIFVSSIYEVANSPPTSKNLMYTIFGEDLIGQIAANNEKIYEAIEQTTQYLAWKIRQAQILIFRRTNPNHGWESVRKVLIDILKSGNTTDRIISGMASSILQDVVGPNSKTWRDNSPLLPRTRFPDVFRVAVHVFNDSIGDCLRNVQAEIVYEAVAARLCLFYARLAADTWRILVVRNGPKEANEWMFINRGVEIPQPHFPQPSPEPKIYTVEDIIEQRLQSDPFRKPKKLPGLFDDLRLNRAPNPRMRNSQKWNLPNTPLPSSSKISLLHPRNL